MKSLYKEKNLDKLFKQSLLVTEKIDAPRIKVKKVNDGFEIFKANSNTALNVVDRTLTSLYENAYEHFSSFWKDMIEEVPDNYIFEMYYMTNTKPVRTEYDRLPKNNLILISIQVMENDKVKKIIREPKILNEWADKFEIEHPPILFNDKLSENQKFKLKELLSQSSKDVFGLFSNSSFTAHIMSVLDPRIHEMTLNKDTHKNTNGFIFTFHAGKVVSNLLLQSSLKESNDSYTPNDSYDLVLLDLVEYMIKDESWEHILLKEHGEDLRYLECISNIFNMYMEKNMHRLLGMSLEKMDFANKPEFKLNKKNIKNKRTNELLDIHVLSEIFQAMLGSFRKHRSKETTLISNAAITEINLLIDKINEKIGKEPDIIEDSDEVKDFESFMISEGRDEIINNINLSLKDLEIDQLNYINTYINKQGLSSKIKEIFSGLGLTTGIDKVVNGFLSLLVGAGGSLEDNIEIVDKLSIDGTLFNDLDIGKVSNFKNNLITNSKFHTKLIKTFIDWEPKKIDKSAIGKGEAFLIALLGGRKAEHGDIKIGDNNYEVKGRGARLKAQRGYGTFINNEKTFIKDFSSVVNYGFTPKEKINNKYLDKKKNILPFKEISKNINNINFTDKGLSMYREFILNADNPLKAVEVLQELFRKIFVNVSNFNELSFLDTLNSSASEKKMLMDFKLEYSRFIFDYYKKQEKWDYLMFINLDNANYVCIEKSNEFVNLIKNGKIKINVSHSWTQTQNNVPQYTLVA